MLSITNNLLHNRSRIRGDRDTASSENVGGPPGLWGLGLSADAPDPTP
jgi:hypothetical protein